MHRFRRLFLAVMILLIAGAGQAWAHAALVSSEPADGSVVEEAPERFRLSFNEPVSPVVLTLVGPAGEPIRLERHHLHDGALIVEAPQDMAQGSYALSWRVTSADGHPIAGSVIFSVGAPSGTPAAGLESAEGLGPLIWAARLGLYLGLFLGVGALGFHAFVMPAPPLARCFSLAMIGVGLTAVLPSAALQGLDLTGARLADALSADVWDAAISSTYFRTLLTAALAMTVALVAWLLKPGRLLGALSAIALAGVGAALAASGHASAADPEWLTRPAVFLHGVALAAWTGSLVSFVLTLGTGGDAARHMLSRYSAAILPVVAVLAVSGAALAVVQVERPLALVETAYGRVLLIKIGLLVLLFTLAALNRFSLTPAFTARERGAGNQFARSVRLELVLVCAILAVASLWRFTPPPRSLAAVAAAPAAVHLHGAKAMAELTVEAGRSGAASASAYLMTGDFGPLEPKEVTLSLANPPAGIEAIRRDMVREAEGRWVAAPLVLPVSGSWQVRLDILVTDFEMVTLEGEIAIRP